MEMPLLPRCSGRSSPPSDFLSLPSFLHRKPLRRSYRRRRPQWLLPVAAMGEKIEIRVCVNRTCNRMGSREILATLSDISPPGVTVKSCGCLSRCGAGPNLVVLPRGTIIGHCGTAARAADLLAEICAGNGGGPIGGFNPRKNLEALALRKKAEAVLQERGNPSEAEALLSQVIISSLLSNFCYITDLLKLFTDECRPFISILQAGFISYTKPGLVIFENARAVSFSTCLWQNVEYPVATRIFRNNILLKILQ